jgi:hypothetical protein
MQDKSGLVKYVGTHKIRKTIPVENLEKVAFVEGSRVQHLGMPEWGIGIVKRIEKEKITIRFFNVGSKEFLISLVSGKLSVEKPVHHEHRKPTAEEDAEFATNWLQGNENFNIEQHEGTRNK